MKLNDEFDDDDEEEDDDDEEESELVKTVEYWSVESLFFLLFDKLFGPVAADAALLLDVVGAFVFGFFSDLEMRFSMKNAEAFSDKIIL